MIIEDALDDDTGGEKGEHKVPEPVYMDARNPISLAWNVSERYLLEAVPRAIDLGRTRSGKDSPRYTQGVGPHVVPKMKT